MSTSAAPTAPGLDIAGYALAVGGTLLFSTKAIFVKLAYAHGVPTETLLALRMIVALPVYGVILVVLLRRGGAWRDGLGWQVLAATMAVGVLGYYVSSYLDFLGLQYVTTQYERLVLFTYPFFVVILGVAFFGDRMVWGVVPGMLVSYLGIAVIFGWSLLAQPEGLVTGTVLVLAAAISFAFYQHLARRQMVRIGSGFFTCIGMSAAGIVAIGHNGVVNGAESLLRLDATALGYGFALGIVCTVLPSFMLNAGIARIGARATASTGALGPPMTAVIAVMVLGEAFTPFHAVGTALVILGAVIFGRAEHRAKVAAAEP